MVTRRKMIQATFGGAALITAGAAAPHKGKSAMNVRLATTGLATAMALVLSTPTYAETPADTLKVMDDSVDVVRKHRTGKSLLDQHGKISNAVISPPVPEQRQSI